MQDGQEQQGAGAAGGRQEERGRHRGGLREQWVLREPDRDVQHRPDIAARLRARPEVIEAETVANRSHRTR